MSPVMQMDLMFFVNSILFGVGLAMDAFSVSMANGLNEPRMKKNKMVLIASVFCFFQIAMPLFGWICVRTIVEAFTSLQKFIPWIALILLLYIGIKMIAEGVRFKDEEENRPVLRFGTLIIQGIATAIDALSVGFTIADYSFIPAFTESVIIGIVTFVISYAGVIIGKKFGTKLSGKASILGGVVLVLIGIEIFVKGLIG